LGQRWQLSWWRWKRSRIDANWDDEGVRKETTPKGTYYDASSALSRQKMRSGVYTRSAIAYAWLQSGWPRSKRW
jgi:hypothetical protein